MPSGGFRNDYPSFQVWRPASINSTIYNRIGEVQLQSDDQVTNGSNNFLQANIILTGGYYHPLGVCYLVKDIHSELRNLYITIIRELT